MATVGVKGLSRSHVQPIMNSIMIHTIHECSKLMERDSFSLNQAENFKVRNNQQKYPVIATEHSSVSVFSILW